MAHRFIYEATYGPIPSGQQIDHRCNNTRCVNVEHVEAVTPRENVLRGNTITAANSVRTHCLRGHPLSGDDLFVRQDGRRRCRTCERATSKRLRSTDEYRQKHADYEHKRRTAKREAK